ncbi:MAG: adenylate kinase [Thermoprotei archaeon]|nr:MAG: adenylate kinase [Thermoprotei archaeon]RLE99555.1 MAG: adenylate kinase [Thermoprotei archaeon]
MKIVMLGPPGIGKGSYAKELSKRLNIPHISTGDIFREEIKKNTDLGKRVRSYVEKGELVPDDIVVEVVRRRLSESDCAKGFILDGYPRTLRQAEELDKITKIDLVFNFVAPLEVIIDRVSGRRICRKCGAIYHIKYKPPRKEGVCDICGGELYQREDDKPEIVRNRLKIYEEQFRPIVQYYKNKGILVTVNAARTIDEVVKECVSIIKKLESYKV